MNDVYGVDPSSLKSVRDLADLIRIISPSEGRFISQFPVNWAEQLKQSMGNLSDLDKSKFVELWLSKARNGLLPTDVRFQLNTSWVENAQRLRPDTRALIGSEKDRPRVIPLETALVDPTVFPDARSEHIKRTVEEYVRVAKPLFQISNRVVLIDPYFRLSYRDGSSDELRSSGRHQRSLRGLLKACVAARRVEIFCLVLDETLALKPYNRDDAELWFERELAQVQIDADAESLQIEYQYLNREAFTDQHPRYLLGNHAGLHFDWGFDTGDSSQRNLVSWLSESALVPLLKRYF
jgi:hypothetical protein